MYPKTLVAAAALAIVSADFSGDASSVAAFASKLGASVSAWNSNSGLAGALGIQSSFPSFVGLVDSLSADADSLTSSELNSDQINSLVSAVVSLLNTLTEKAADFKAVGATEIVAGDISSAQGPAVAVASALVKAAGNDAASYSAALSSYASAFDAADDAYGVAKGSFPSVGAASSGGSSSSGAATSSAAASSSASATGSSAASSASSAAESSKVATESSAAASSVQVANGATGLVAGIGAAAAGVAAMLL